MENTFERFDEYRIRRLQQARELSRLIVVMLI